MDYRELMRRKLLEEMYDKMSDEDKRTYAQLTMQDKDHHEIMQALNRQQSSMDDMQQQIGRHGWLSGFSSNIAGNAVWDGAVWVVSRLLKL